MNPMVLTFDTLQYAKKLQKAGFTEEQAEIKAEALQERTNAINHFMDSNLSTKQDLKILRQDLTIRLGSMIAASVVTLGVLVSLMLKFAH